MDVAHDAGIVDAAQDAGVDAESSDTAAPDASPDVALDAAPDAAAFDAAPADGASTDTGPGAAVAVCYCAGSWCRYSGCIPDEGVYRVHAAGPNDLYFTYGGRRRTLHFDGKSWELLEMPFKAIRMVGIAPNALWALSEQWSLWRWNGTTWQQQPQKEVRLLFVAADGSVLAGRCTDVTLSGNFWYSAVELARFDGTTWTSLPSLDGPVGVGLCGYNPLIWAFSGTDIHIITHTTGVDESHHYQNGSWSSIPHPPGLASKFRFVGIWGSSSGDLYLSGAPDGVLRLPAGAASWTLMPNTSSATLGAAGPLWGTPTELLLMADKPWRFDGVGWTAIGVSPPAYNSIFPGTPPNWHMAGSGSTVLLQAGGFPFRYDGTTFNALLNRPVGQINDVWSSSSSDVYLVGTEGIFHYDGSSLKLQAGPPPLVWTNVWGSGPNDVYALSGTTLAHYDGASWKTIALKRAGTHIWGSGPNDVFVLSDPVQHFDGNSWTDQPLPPHQQLHRIAGYDKSYVLIMHGGYTPGTECGDHGQLLRYDGSTWLAEPLPAGATATCHLWSPGPKKLYVAIGFDTYGYKGSASGWVKIATGNGRSFPLGGSADSDLYAWAGNLQRYDGSKWNSDDDAFVGGNGEIEVWATAPGKAWVFGARSMLMQRK